MHPLPLLGVRTAVALLDGGDGDSYLVVEPATGERSEKVEAATPPTATTDKPQAAQGVPESFRIDQKEQADQHGRRGGGQVGDRDTFSRGNCDYR